MKRILYYTAILSVACICLKKFDKGLAVGKVVLDAAGKIVRILNK